MNRPGSTVPRDPSICISESAIMSASDRRVSGFVTKNKGAVAVYGGVAILLLMVAHFLSDRDFSFLMVCARFRLRSVCPCHPRADAGKRVSIDRICTFVTEDVVFKVGCGPVIENAGSVRSGVCACSCWCPYRQPRRRRWAPELRCSWAVCALSYFMRATYPSTSKHRFVHACGRVAWTSLA